MDPTCTCTWRPTRVHGFNLPVHFFPWPLCSNQFWERLQPTDHSLRHSARGQALTERSEAGREKITAVLSIFPQDIFYIPESGRMLCPGKCWEGMGECLMSLLLANGPQIHCLSKPTLGCTQSSVATLPIVLFCLAASAIPGFTPTKLHGPICISTRLHMLAFFQKRRCMIQL